MAGSDLVVNLGLNATAFTRGLTSASAKLGTLGAGVGKTSLRRGSGVMNAGFMNLNRTLSVTKGLVGGIGLGLAAMAGKAITMAASTEQMRISFEVLAKDKDIGNALFSEMEQLAQNTSLTIADTTQAAKQLLISFDAANIPGLVRTLGNISEGMSNVSLQDMAFLLQTSRTEGKLLARDLRQFTTRGIDLSGELQKVFGLEGLDAGEKLTEMVSAGEVGIQHVMEALQTLGSNNMLERQANTLTGSFNQARDAIGLMTRDFGEVLAKTLGLTDFMKSLKDGAIGMRESIKSNLPIIEMLIETGKAFGTMWIQVFSDAAAAVGILTGASELSTTQILEGLVTIMAVASHVFKNWRLWGELAVFAVLLQVEKMVADIEHAFTVKVPAYFNWFLDNWKQIFFMAGTYVVLFLVNALENIGLFLVEVRNYIKTWGQSGWNPMFTSLDRGFKEMNEKYGPSALPDLAPRATTALEDQLTKGMETTAGQIVNGMDKDIDDALARFRDFTPEEEGPGLGPAFAEQFAERGKKSTKKVDRDKQKLGVMQRGSSQAISAVIKAMGGREKTLELLELKRQTKMLKYFGDQLKREERYAELHPQGPI